MSKTVVGLYDHFDVAEEAIRELVNQGFARENISIIANDGQGRHAQSLGDQAGRDEDNIETKGEAAAKGAGIGAALGGITGLLVGIGTFALPGIGPVLGAGPLITALSGAGLGAVTGGLAGALTEVGVPETDANIFEEGVRRGGTLVMVYTSDDEADRAADILNRSNPVNLEERSGSWKKESWSGFTETVEPFAFDRTTQTYRERQPSSQLDFGPGARSYIAGQPVSAYDRSSADLGNFKNDPLDIDWDTMEQRFRKDFETRYEKIGGQWSDFRDMYHYGYEMGRQERYSTGDWDLVRENMRQEWEMKYRDRDWDRYEEAVYEGWRAGRSPHIS